MIYDGHAYCFPSPSSHSGSAEAKESRRLLHLAMAVHRMQPAWRKRDRAPSDSLALADPSRDGLDAVTEVEVRLRDHGRIEWTVEGEEYVKQALPPWTVDFAFPPETLIAEMDYAGVDKALLHRTPYMGISNEFIAECVRHFPGRLEGLAYIPEWQIEPSPDDAIRELGHAIDELGLSGLQFNPYYGRLYGRARDWNARSFKPFWDAVATLDVPVFFTLSAGSLDAYVEELKALRTWMDRYPHVKVVQTHGFNWRLFAGQDTLTVPDAVYEAAPMGNPRYHVQVLFAVFLQTRWEYPMPQVRATLHEMVDRLGADRILWGTDIPIVLLHWTYRQNLDYIRNYCDFMSRAEMEMVLGGNMSRLMGAAGPE